jgi:hypothetical protein
VLDVFNWSTADGAAVVQWAEGNGANQQFRLADSDSGYVRLINRNSGKAAEVAGLSTAGTVELERAGSVQGRARPRAAAGPKSLSRRRSDSLAGSRSMTPIWHPRTADEERRCVLVNRVFGDQRELREQARLARPPPESAA